MLAVALQEQRDANNNLKDERQLKEEEEEEEGSCTRSGLSLNLVIARLCRLLN